MSTKPPTINQGVVPLSTVVPDDDKMFTPYFTRTYENLAQAINAKDNGYFVTAISDTPTNIPNVANFGAFIICVSGAEQAKDKSWPPTYTAALTKASNSVAGVITPIGTQAGQGALGSTWVGVTLDITSTATNFQIAHSKAGLTGNFNIKIIGTQ